MSDDAKENILVGACIGFALVAMVCLWLAWDYL